MITRKLSIWLSVLIVTIGAAGTTTAEAAELDLASSPILRIAMMGLGPSPGASMISPSEMQWLDELIAEEAWVFPERAQWPLDDDGKPIVETRRVEEKWHTLQRGERLARLRTMYRRTTAQLQELNPDVDLRNLEQGQEILVWRRDEDAVAESRGQPQSGRIIYSEPFPRSDDYIVLFPYRVFGTHYTISESVRILDEYYEAFADAAPLIVGDASFRTGRKIHPHNSHQAGRDIDITLPRLEEPPNYNRFHHIRRDNLDAERTLFLLTTLLEGGFVQYVFLDWHHQRTLYMLARDQGAPEEWLETVFQYPRRGGQGIIRHASGHRGHFHIRFHCQETDRWCR